MKTSTLPQKKKKRVQEPSSFGQKEVDFSAVFPMPEGYEKLFLALYFITIPYAVGLLFLFIFVAKGHFDSFMSLDIAMFVAVWGIGYEVVGSIALIIIFYKMFRFNRGVRTTTPRIREKPAKKLYEIHDFS